MTAAPLPLRIVILGGGTAGWMTASLMAQRWRDEGATITVVESPEIGIIGVGEGSTPQLRAFFRKLGIADADWMPRCNATFKVGIKFQGWSEVEGFESYFHPFPSAVDTHTEPAFYFNSLLRRGGYDAEAHPDRFFLAARLAREKLSPAPAETFPFDVPYGYHFDAHLVGAMLRDHAVARGVRHLEARVVGVERAADGDLAALALEGDRRIEADVFVDASGFRGVLIQEALGVPFRSFGENLFNDRAVVTPTPAAGAGVNVQTVATAMKHGWRWDIPLTNRHGNGYVYSSAFVSDDDAERELREALAIPESAPGLRRLQMKVGQVARHWERNCLAVGLSQGFIEPLEATALHLVQATVEGFIEAFEAGGRGSARRDVFNAEISARFAGVRDYIVCHYRMNRRTDTEYWRANAANDALSDTLKAMITAWFTGRDMNAEIDRLGISKYYTNASWHCLFAGYGRFPDTNRIKPPEPHLQRFDMADIDDFIRRCALNFRPASRAPGLVVA